MEEQTVIKRVSMKPEHGNFGQLYQKACYMSPVCEVFVGEYLMMPCPPLGAMSTSCES